LGISSLPALNVLDQFRKFVNEIVGRSHFSDSSELGLLGNRFMRFLVAGGVNTLFGFAVYSICILAGMAVWLALLIGMLSGTLFNFITTGGYVFRELSLGRFPRFLICYFLVYGINFMLIELISIWLNSKILSQAIITFPLALLSYFLMVRFVFSSE
jgi:putative flippase GtrA